VKRALSEVWDSGGKRGRGAALIDDADRRQKAKGITVTVH